MPKGFIKTAAARIVPEHKDINLTQWGDIIGRDIFKDRIAGRVIKNYSPDDYLLTHCTIISSVNVDPKVDHYITPATARYVNNNGDSWESSLLSEPKVYKSFEGAHNFVEHVQEVSLSKGRIIAAALREVPADDSNSKEKVYFVDILVATDRKHRQLISKISSGELNTLSMGCHVGYTICSKCGHRAEEEADLCMHIKHMKGSYFYDETGTRRIIAELCGHRDDTDSVRFIEASWVAVPAFSGAVMRNILSFQDNKKGEKAKEKYAGLIEKAHNIDPFENIPETALNKAASLNNELSQSIQKLKKIANQLRNLI